MLKIPIFESFVSWRYLRARRQEGFISVTAGFSFFGILLGVATLIIVMSVMNGFRQELLNRILGLNGHLNVFAIAGKGRPLKDFDPLVDQLRLIPGITSVTPLIERQGMVTFQGTAVGVMVRGIREEDLKKRSLIVNALQTGSLESGEPGLVIGRRLAERLGVEPGNRVTLIAPEGFKTAFGTMPQTKAYPVIAVFEIGMFEYDNGVIFMPLEESQRFFRLPEAVSDLEIFVADLENLPYYKSQILPILGVKARLLDWQKANGAFFDAVQVERNVMFLILTLIIVVAAFNIISSLIMLVKDKGHDIAILRTMGATRGMILRIFLMNGMMIGVSGAVGGLILGLLFCYNIEAIRQFLQALTDTQLFPAEVYFLSKMPAVVKESEVVSVVSMAVGLTLLAAFYPAWRAARLDPVEVLRYE